MWEPSVNYFIRNNLGQGDWFVDIGAYRGDHSFTAAEVVGADGKVFAFEADLARADELNIEVNRRKNQNVVVFSEAVGPDVERGRSEFLSVAQRIDLEGKGLQTLIKVDVDGGEIQVLQTCLALVRAGCRLLLEVSSTHSESAAEVARSVGVFLDKNQLSIRRILKNGYLGPYIAPREIPSHNFRTPIHFLLTAGIDEKACPICGSTSKRLLREFDIERTRTSGQNNQLSERLWAKSMELYKLQESSSLVHPARCKSCKGIFLAERPSEELVAQRYSILSENPDSLYSKEHATSQIVRAETFSSFIEKFVKSKTKAGLSYLDYGGANGRILAIELKNQANDCFVWDLASIPPIDGVKSLSIHDFETVGAQNFDVIVLAHVLEHLGTPLRELARVRRLLSDDGVLYIEVPHGCAREHRVGRLIDPFGHVNFFSKCSLTNLLSNSGFEVVFSEIVILPYGPSELSSIRMVARTRSGKDFPVRPSTSGSIQEEWSTLTWRLQMQVALGNRFNRFRIYEFDAQPKS